MSKYLKSAGSAKIGRKFFKAREKLGLSVEEINSSIYINIIYIKAIESGDYAAFPSESFARAYFKKYSDFLKIKPTFPNIYRQEKINSRIKKKLEIKINKTFTENIYLFYIIITISSLALIGLFFRYI
tara:strand:- start:3959 stop:4342 length:384 start_codon:yes stop_codon:yes gene_type:complete